MMAIPKRRVYISAPMDEHLDASQVAIKRELLGEIAKRDMEPQEFLRRGSVARKAWTFQNAADLMARCQGALILGLARSHWQVKSGTYLTPSEYCHYEGALALGNKIPTLIVAERGVVNRGIVSTAGGEPIAFVDKAKPLPVLSDIELANSFQLWLADIESRARVFLGYCSKARNTATDIHQFIERDLQVPVLNYAMDFVGGGSILDEIERAARECTCGIFLFTNDDPLKSPTPGQAAPRDNVVFEAGFFMHAKGKDRALIIREEGAKMPADIGGSIYVPLKNRKDISTIHRAVEKFLCQRL